MPGIKCPSEVLLGWIDLEASEISDENIARVPVMPTGVYQHPKGGRLNITADQLAELATTIDAQKPVDYDHSFARGRGSKAAGWFVPGTAAVEDGVLKADVRFTPAAAEQVRSGEYRFISPEWNFRKKTADGKMVQPYLKAAALTNRPFFDNMEPVMLADRGLEESLVSPFLLADDQRERAIGVLGDEPFQALFTAATSIDPSTHESARSVILAAAAPDDKENDMDLTAFAEALGLTADASQEDILAAAAAAKEEKEKLAAEVETLKASVPAPDALAALAASAQKGEQAAAELAAMRKENLLASAVSRGAILPAQKDTYGSLYDSAPEQTANLLASLPDNAALPTRPIGSDANGRFGGLTASSQSTVKVDGIETPVDKDRAQIHERTLALLAEQGKVLDYTADDYIAAASMVAGELGLANLV